MTPSQLDTINSIASMLFSFVALIVSLIALVYTAKTYLLKSGAYIRGSRRLPYNIYILLL
jgi:hypothetical protein